MIAKNTRIEVINNSGLVLDVGAKATVILSEGGNDLLCLADGEKEACCLPLDQCDIIS